MPSTATIASSPMYDEPTLRGARRSRFSFHLNTRRSRRWLLVQLVSVPLHDTEHDAAGPAFRHAQRQAAQHRTLGQLLDSYANSRLFSH